MLTEHCGSAQCFAVKKTLSAREREMEKNILYSDRLIEIAENTILFRKYYFPTFSNKVVEFSEVEKIVIENPTIKNGKFRYWGSGDFLHWFPIDFQRSQRDVIYILFRKNKRIRIGFTVEDSKKVTELLKEKTIDIEINVKHDINNYN